MFNPLVSVIVPVYKVEAYLERCVNSIMNQTYGNLEIILVDDGSPDNCGTICDQLSKKDTRITVYHKPNGGLSDARNYGVARSHGSYITFIDSDDYISPDFVTYLYDSIVKHHADISCCCMVKTTSDTVDYGLNNSFPSEQVLSGYSACMALSGNLYLTLVTAWGKLYKSEIVKKYPFPAGKKHEDEATTCKYYYASNKVVIGNRRLYAYYQNPTSITHSKGDTLNTDAIWALTHKGEFFEANNEKVLAGKTWAFLFNYYVSDSKKHAGRCDEYLKNFKENKSLLKSTAIELSAYNISPILFRCCRSVRVLCRKIKTMFRLLSKRITK